jgi:hypothetical protein
MMIEHVTGNLQTNWRRWQPSFLKLLGPADVAVCRVEMWNVYVAGSAPARTSAPLLLLHWELLLLLAGAPGLLLRTG